MTPRQVRWASAHDWYLSATGGAWLTVTVRDDVQAGGELTFTSFNKLKEWAGY